MIKRIFHKFSDFSFYFGVHFKRCAHKANCSIVSAFHFIPFFMYSSNSFEISLFHAILHSSSLFRGFLYYKTTVFENILFLGAQFFDRSPHLFLGVTFYINGLPFCKKVAFSFRH